MGRAKGQTTESNAPEYVARPLSSLKDPNSFGPPPKKNSYSQVSSPTTPVSQHGTSAAYGRQSAQESEEPKSSEPYRRDTTGLSTSHLPPPPGRRERADEGLRRRRPSHPSRPGYLPGKMKTRAIIHHHLHQHIMKLRLSHRRIGEY